MQVAKYCILSLRLVHLCAYEGCIYTISIQNEGIFTFVIPKRLSLYPSMILSDRACRTKISWHQFCPVPLSCTAVMEHIMVTVFSWSHISLHILLSIRNFLCDFLMSPFSISSCWETISASKAYVIDFSHLHRWIHYFAAEALNSMNEFVLHHPENSSPPVFLLISHRALSNIRHLNDHLTVWKERFLSNNSSSSKSTIIPHSLCLLLQCFPGVIWFFFLLWWRGNWSIVGCVMTCRHYVTLNWWRIRAFLG